MKKPLKVLAVVLPLVLLVGAFIFRQDLYDSWRLSQYDPSARIEQITETTTMTDEATKYFYVAHPEIDTREAFNENCNIEEFSIVLGCYDGRNIYVYDVKDKRLNGIIEVTAAHEMLHAAYDRLSSDKQAQVDAMTAAAYKKLNNKRIEAAVTQYKKADPSVVPNELHSILGTEVADLPQELEDYYKQYFDDRAKIVALSEKYEKQFSSREEQVAALDDRLASLKATIDANEADLRERAADLTAERARMDGLRAAGNTAAYNAAVDGFNAQVAAYNALVRTTTDQIEEYNTLVKDRNDLATEVQGLVEAIDSTPETINE